MQFKPFETSFIPAMVALWNTSVVKAAVYKEFSDETFTQKFLKNPYFDPNGMKLLFDDESLIGWGHAIVNQNEQAPGFITAIAVDKKYQRQGYGTLILHELENYLQNEKQKKLIRLFFANPVNLEWYVPDTRCDHPNAPAVPFNSPFYYLLMNNGYTVNGQMDAFYLGITDYELPKKVVDKDKENEAKGYFIELYDAQKHHGLKEVFDALKAPDWCEIAMNNLKKEKPDPMLIVQKDGQILGWTGPLYPQPSGRGYFGGIGVHPDVQGFGLGKSLFSHLVYESKKYGATFMTFFTGSDNLARNIYLHAGFKIVHSFVVLRKELK